MTTIDTRGTKCPVPIIMTRKALKENKGEPLQVLTDNKTSFENLSSFFNDNHIQYSSSEDNGQYSFIINHSGHIDDLSVKEYCKPETSDKILHDTVVVIKSRKMGDGDELLGIMLLEAFINSLTESDHLPSSIIFYNDGIRLLTDDSPIQKTIRQLIDKNVNVIYCGTCVDYYELKDKISIGTVTNMLNITESLLKAEKIMYP